jgi:CBS domain-containing protein
MDKFAPTATAADERLFRLSDLLKGPVWLGEQKLGALCDLVILDRDVAAEVTHVCVRRPFGRPTLFVPWSNVEQLANRAVRLDPQTQIKAAEKRPHAAVLLQDYIVDKKVLDTDGREVEVVYDVMMAMRNDHLYVVGVDLSRRALLRRLGLKWLANLTAGITDRIENDVVPWKFIEPLPEGIGSFAGDLRLKVLGEQLAKMPPIDVARILEQLDNEHRMVIFNTLETDNASDTLEQLDPKSLRELMAVMPREKAANLIDAMTPGQAADVLAQLPYADVQAIFALMEPRKARKVRIVLDQQEWHAIDYATTDFVKLHPDTTIAQARQSLQQAKERQAVAYLYVLDHDDRLLGLVSTVDLLLAPEDARLQQFMKGSPIRLSDASTLQEATDMFSRYGYRALPVVDKDDKMQGLVLYRDVMGLNNRHLK